MQKVKQNNVIAFLFESKQLILFFIYLQKVKQNNVIAFLFESKQLILFFIYLKIILVFGLRGR